MTTQLMTRHAMSSGCFAKRFRRPSTSTMRLALVLWTIPHNEATPWTTVSNESWAYFLKDVSRHPTGLAILEASWLELFE